MNTIQPTRLKRRIRQLERCLEAVLDWTAEQEYRLRSSGRDNAENDLYRALNRLDTRINRTLASKQIK